VESAGYIPVALSADDYIEMLPATWRAVNAYGIKISHRIYDSDELNPFRRQPSGVTRENLWEVHRDRHHTPDSIRRARGRRSRNRHSCRACMPQGAQEAPQTRASCAGRADRVRQSRRAVSRDLLSPLVSGPVTGQIE
jgi:hypothetical protein